MKKSYFRNLKSEEHWGLSDAQIGVLEEILRLTKQNDLLWTQTYEKEFRATAFIANDSNPRFLYPVSLRAYVGYFEEFGIPVDIPMIELEVDGEKFADNIPKHSIVNDIYRAVSNDNIYTPSDMLRNTPVNHEGIKQTLRNLRRKKIPPSESHRLN